MEIDPFVELICSKITCPKVVCCGITLSTKIEFPVDYELKSIEHCSKDFAWATAVTGFGLLLRNSDFIHDFDYDQAFDWAYEAHDQDNKLQDEMLDLILIAEKLEENKATKKPIKNPTKRENFHWQRYAQSIPTQREERNPPITPSIVLAGEIGDSWLRPNFLPKT